jgi:hypothetical protein
MVPRALDLLPDGVFTHGISSGHQQVVRWQRNESFPPTRREPKREFPFMDLLNEAVLKFFVYAAYDTP